MLVPRINDEETSQRHTFLSPDVTHVRRKFQITRSRLGRFLHPGPGQKAVGHFRYAHGQLFLLRQHCPLPILHVPLPSSAQCRRSAQLPQAIKPLTLIALRGPGCTIDSRRRPAPSSSTPCSARASSHACCSSLNALLSSRATP